MHCSIAFIPRRPYNVPGIQAYRVVSTTYYCTTVQPVNKTPLVSATVPLHCLALSRQLRGRGPTEWFLPCFGSYVSTHERAPARVHSGKKEEPRPFCKREQADPTRRCWGAAVESASTPRRPPEHTHTRRAPARVQEHPCSSVEEGATSTLVKEEDGAGSYGNCEDRS